MAPRPPPSPALFAALGLLSGLLGCKTTAPNTMAAATINTALAATLAGISLANGGCVAICTNGLVCNPKTGLCEKQPDFKCLGPDPATGLCNNRPEDMNAARAAEAGRSTLPPGLGISPATGSVPPPPADASPRPFSP